MNKTTKHDASSGQKIKVLVVPSDRTGVSYFRSTKPHITLEELYPDEFHVDIEYEPKLEDDKWLKKYDLVHFHRTLGSYERMGDWVDENGNKREGTISRLNRLGIVSIMDIDDYWSPGPHHPAYHIIKANKVGEKIVSNIKLANHVTTTTPIYAKEIERLNKNVHVLPNAIDPNDKQFTPTPEKSDRIRIGWLGGSSHLHDLKILNGVVAKLKRDGLMDKIQFVLCGYDLRGVVTMIDERTGEQKQRKIQPKESVWFQYEQIFTDNFNSVSPKYKEYLLTFQKGEYEGFENEPYRRVWTKPISTYASNYNLFDISLAPLEENTFNKVKSQLKVIEAGFHKKALIAQDFGPYQIDLKNAYVKGGGWDENANAIMIDKNKNHKDWYKHLKRLIQNPELIDQLSENLHNTVKDLYSIEKVTEDRRNLYKELLSKN